MAKTAAGPAIRLFHASRSYTTDSNSICPAHEIARCRGQYFNKLEKVTPGVPAFILQLQKNAPQNRLALAQWLMDPKNPLTARVEVNRYWQRFFGIGIVKTAEDFGVQGESP